MAQNKRLSLSLQFHISDSHSDDSQGSPLTARKRLTGTRDLAWARQHVWGTTEDNRDEYMTQQELMNEGHAIHEAFMEAIVILALHQTRVENKHGKI